MFHGWVRDLTNTGGICHEAHDLSNLLSTKYLLPEEQLLFAWTSAKHEFAFTNFALITAHGENATTTRKLIRRFEYREHLLSNVRMVTTGLLDLDCEIVFDLAGEETTIDVKRREQPMAQNFYRMLVLLAREQHERSIQWRCQSVEGVQAAAESLRMDGLKGSGLLVDQASVLLTQLESAFDQQQPRCYRHVIESGLEAELIRTTGSNGSDER